MSDKKIPPSKLPQAHDALHILNQELDKKIDTASQKLSPVANATSTAEVALAAVAKDPQDIERLIKIENDLKKFSAQSSTIWWSRLAFLGISLIINILLLINNLLKKEQEQSRFISLRNITFILIGVLIATALGFAPIGFGVACALSGAYGMVNNLVELASNGAKLLGYGLSPDEKKEQNAVNEEIKNLRETIKRDSTFDTKQPSTTCNENLKKLTDRYNTRNELSKKYARNMGEQLNGLVQNSFALVGGILASMVFLPPVSALGFVIIAATAGYGVGDFAVCRILPKINPVRLLGNLLLDHVLLPKTTVSEVKTVLLSDFSREKNATRWHKPNLSTEQTQQMPVAKNHETLKHSIFSEAKIYDELANHNHERALDVANEAARHHAVQIIPEAPKAPNVSEVKEKINTVVNEEKSEPEQKEVPPSLHL